MTQQKSFSMRFFSSAFCFSFSIIASFRSCVTLMLTVMHEEDEEDEDKLASEPDGAEARGFLLTVIPLI